MLTTGRLMMGNQREFVMADWDGVNRSGYQPLDDKILVLMDTHADTTMGGIMLPEQAVERQTTAAETGVIVALGEAAYLWNDELTRAWSGRKPVVGDRCYIERYSGQEVQGVDGRTYRLMSQKCVGAIFVGAPDE